MSNPTKIVQEEIVNLYCGAGFVNPDKKNILMKFYKIFKIDL